MNTQDGPRVPPTTERSRDQMKRAILNNFREGVRAGTLAALAKAFPRIREKSRDLCKRIDTNHVRDIASGARFWTIEYVIEMEREELENQPGAIAVHCAMRFGELLINELRQQSVKQLDDILILVDPLKPSVAIMNGTEPGIAVVGLRLWLAVPKVLPEGLKAPIRRTPEEIALAEEKRLVKKSKEIHEQIMRATRGRG